MKRLSIIFLVFLMALGLVACGKKNEYKGDHVGGSAAESGSNAKIVVDDGRKIIYNVYYQLSAKDITTYERKLDSKVNELNGYIEKLDTRTYASTCTYRVPKAKLDEFVSYVDSFDGLVEDKKVTSQDVSTTYNSNQARKEVLEASRTSYVNMLTDDTLSVSDIIAINDKIEKIDIELREIYLTLDTYDSLIEYSTVTVDFYEKGEYKEPTFMDEYLNYIGEFFITIGKVILYLLPVAFIGGIAAVITLVSIKHHKNKNRKNKENENTENKE